MINERRNAVIRRFLPILLMISGWAYAATPCSFQLSSVAGQPVGVTVTRASAGAEMRMVHLSVQKERARQTAIWKNTTDDVWQKLRLHELLVNQQSLPGRSGLCGTACLINILQAMALASGRAPLQKPSVVFREIVESRESTENGLNIDEHLKMLKHIAKAHFEPVHFKMSAVQLKGVDYSEPVSSVDRLDVEDLTPRKGSFKLLMLAWLNKKGAFTGHHSTLIKSLHENDMRMVDGNIPEIDLTAARSGHFPANGILVPRYTYTTEGVPEDKHSFVPYAVITLVTEPAGEESISRLSF